VLARDRYQCQLRHDGCLIAAHNLRPHCALDRWRRGHRPELPAVCKPCHRRITSREANYIQHGAGECPWPDDDPTLKAEPPAPPQPAGAAQDISARRPSDHQDGT
jgi:hypothetical protein